MHTIDGGTRTLKRETQNMKFTLFLGPATSAKVCPAKAPTPWNKPREEHIKATITNYNLWTSEPAIWSL